ncbi:uncharacterized protein B0P05DRAFT_592451 [Gilbertella persicaria]|uniref:uncharacterized protein n=1 Tax=Gilbertella persicaria TaxID=101096 RepID=UPI002220E372|nr:uncharacterized protein B0P05DRAFT_592451 [Gilbertella persicaria]KAI8047975.1 hypothetical protein B0P05DRAFT_592451 [Gilbertella persicaria]
MPESFFTAFINYHFDYFVNEFIIPFYFKPTRIAPKHSISPLPPPLLIKDKEEITSLIDHICSSPVQTDCCKKKKRHYSISISDSIEFCHPFDNLPQLSPSLSTCSQSTVWSSSSTDTKKSRVEEIIDWFEAGSYHRPERRYSVDSYQPKRYLIPQRKFEYQPTVHEWKKREAGTFPLSASQSTPTRRTMFSIPEKPKAV